MPIVHIEDATPELQCLDESHLHLVTKETDLEIVKGVQLYCAHCHCSWEITV